MLFIRYGGYGRRLKDSQILREMLRELQIANYILDLPLIGCETSLFVKWRSRGDVR